MELKQLQRTMANEEGEIMNDLALHIKEKALSLGYAGCGIIKVDDVAEYAVKLKERMTHVRWGWLQFGQFRKFAKPQKENAWAKSIIITLNDNTVYNIPETLKGVYAKDYLIDSRLNEQSEGWARRLAFGKYLQDLEIQNLNEPKFGVTALRWAASKAGLGIVRANNFFYTENGSAITIDAWLIDKELELIDSVELKKCPEHCGKCITACPTKALSNPFTTSLFDCVSFITTLSVEKGLGMPSTKQQKAIGCRVYGCDVCQDVCPFNKDKWRGGRDFPGLNELAAKLPPEKIMAMNYSEMARELAPQFWYIGVRNLWKWKINAIIAMSNGYSDIYEEPIKLGLIDIDRRVRRFAKKICKKHAIKIS